MQSDKITILTKKASLEFDKMANPFFLEYDLTGAQYKILKYLFVNQDKDVRQVDLEKYYSLTHPTMIGLLANLEKKGFITRKANPDDARSRIVSLTEKTLAIQDVLESLGDELEGRFTKALTEEEKRQLSLLLGKLLTSFE